MLDDHNINKVLFQKYICNKLIGKGSFGVVYSGINTITKEPVAIKMEKKDTSKQGTLEAEAFRLIHLQGEGIPKILCYGSNLTHNILIQELLGKSLENIFNSIGKKFSLKTVCVIGIEIMKLIRFVHSKQHIHRDIKPDNFMMGREENDTKLYIIDFGLGKKYYSSTKKEHIAFSKGKTLTGTARYCARNAHRGYEQSRRDDIESIGYMLLYFLVGVLPWQGLKLNSGERHFEVIAAKKYNTSFEELCRGQPNEFVLYFKHADQLSFEEEPNYDYLIGLFQQMINKHCLDCYYDFDWKKDYCYYLPEKIHKNQSKNMSLIANNIGGQSTLNQSGNAIENSFNNEDEGEANIFINNDNDCGSLNENVPSNHLIVILGQKNNRSSKEIDNNTSLTHKAISKNIINKDEKRNSKSTMKSLKNIDNNDHIKYSRNKQECLIIPLSLTKKVFQSMDVTNINIMKQSNKLFYTRRRSIDICCHYAYQNNNKKKKNNSNKLKRVSSMPYTKNKLIDIQDDKIAYILKDKDKHNNEDTLLDLIKLDNNNAFNSNKKKSNHEAKESTNCKCILF